MKVRASLLFIVFIISAIYIFTPASTVWGGFSMQTVPTIGPTATSSATFTLTSTSAITVFTATSTSPVILPTIPQATIAITLITPAVNETTIPSLQETVIPSATSEQTSQVISSTENLQPTDSTGSVVQNQPGNQNELPAETQTDENPEIKNLPPQWLFPFSGAVLLVVLFLIIRRMIRDHNHKKSAK